MGKRGTGRKLAMQALYQAEIRQQPIEMIVDSFVVESDYEEDTKAWAISLCKNTWEKRVELDEIVKTYSIGWDLDRLNIVDKSLLRLALYEIKYQDTPYTVVLDEVIEISKTFSTEDSPKFINGILGNYVKNECQPESKPS